MVKGRIALLLGQADEAYQQEFVRGVMEQAFSEGYAVLAFSMYIKYQNTKEREIGDSNIFRLFNPALFDAVIVLTDTIQTPGAVEEIEERLEKTFHGPVLCVDTESHRFPSIWSDGYEAIYATISHLIEAHNMRDIAFITGRQQHRHSIRRLEAYRDAMKDHGLPVNENRIFYGDFWYTSGNSAAEALLRDRDNLPEAVTAANDNMAIGVAEVFERNGIRIPEDVAITGYGTSEEGENSPQSLTSSYIPAEDYGRSAVRNVLRLMKDLEIKPPRPSVRLFIGESCGCRGTKIPEQSRRRTTWTTRTSEEGYYSIHNTMLDDLQRSEDLEEFLENVYENLYHLQDVDRFDLCLNSLWLSPEEMLTREFPAKGYSDRIVHAISYDSTHPATGKMGLNSTFSREEMLPGIDKLTPRGYIFTPIYVEDMSLGYAVVSFGEEPRSYAEVYRLWVTALARGLEALRRQMVIQCMERKITELVTAKPLVKSEPAQAVEEILSPEEQAEKDEVERILDENLFTYHFQPIISAVDGSIYSYEALMRSKTEKFISPLTILKYAAQLNRLPDVERLTMTNVMTRLDTTPQELEAKKVFINMIPGCRFGEEEEAKVRALLIKHHETVVLELTEQAELAEGQLEELKKGLRSAGAGMAIDDYGTGYSNVSNLLRYMPDVVKIDRSLLTEIQNSTQKQHFVRDIIEFCHGNNILALAEGVETSEELRTVILLGADLIQGYYTARPAAVVLQELDNNLREEIVRYRQEMIDGSGDEEYIAGRINRISVNQLLREHKSTIVIGEKNAAFRDISIVGTPGEVHKLNIEILEGYEGRVTLENVTLANIKKRPCIHMAENSKLTLRLVGANRMIDGGIQVPEGSSLSLEGEGSLHIRVDGHGGFGIGNTLDQGHGDIAFYQDGEIKMDLNGNRVIGIGAGLGGNLEMNRGKYDIYINGDECVGIGAIDGDNRLIIHDSDIQVDVAAVQGLCIGSLHGNTEMEMWSSLVKANVAGKRVVAVGTLKGERSSIDVHENGFILNVNADTAACVGSFNGRTELSVMNSTFRVNGSGQEVYVYGAKSKDTQVNVSNSDVSIDLRSADGGVTIAPKEKVEYMYGRVRIVLNEAVII